MFIAKCINYIIIRNVTRMSSYPIAPTNPSTSRAFLHFAFLRGVGLCDQETQPQVYLQKAAKGKSDKTWYQ